MTDYEYKVWAMDDPQYKTWLKCRATFPKYANERSSFEQIRDRAAACDTARQIAIAKTGADPLSKDRKYLTVVSKIVVIYELRGKMPLCWISDYFKRTHASVLNHVKRIDNILANPNLERWVFEILMR